MTLGTYPMTSLADARDQARRLLEQVDLGIDPRPARTEAAQAAYDNTVASVAKRFISQECKGHIKSWKRVERTLELHVLPTLGNRPINQVSRQATPPTSPTPLSPLDRARSVRLQPPPKRLWAAPAALRADAEGIRVSVVSVQTKNDETEEIE